MNPQEENDTFELRARELLRGSVESLDGATRSRLTQARHAVLAQRQSRAWWDFRYLAPAGGAAVALLLAVLFVGRDDATAPATATATNALYDLELLADSDAYELAQEADLEFIEWAAAMGEQDQAGT